MMFLFSMLLLGTDYLRPHFKGCLHQVPLRAGGPWHFVFLRLVDAFYPTCFSQGLAQTVLDQLAMFRVLNFFLVNRVADSNHYLVALNGQQLGGIAPSSN